MKPILIVASLLLLSACAEPNQEVTQGRYMPDAHASEGTKGPHMATGWTPGDKRSWEAQLRTRGQYQNEYAKAK